MKILKCTAGITMSLMLGLGMNGCGGGGGSDGSSSGGGSSTNNGGSTTQQQTNPTAPVEATLPTPQATPTL